VIRLPGEGEGEGCGGCDAVVAGLAWHNQERPCVANSLREKRCDDVKSSCQISLDDINTALMSCTF